MDQGGGSLLENCKTATKYYMPFFNKRLGGYIILKRCFKLCYPKLIKTFLYAEFSNLVDFHHKETTSYLQERFSLDLDKVYCQIFQMK